MSINRDEVIIWFDTPPKVSKGAFNYLSRNWGARVYYVCNKDFPDYRKKINWDDGDFGAAEMILLDGERDKRSRARAIIDAHPNAIHIISGFNNGIERLIRPIILTTNSPLVFFSERPDDMGSLFERFIRSIYCSFKYRSFYKLYKKGLRVFLPLGQKGVDTFANYGWPKDIMMPFMYNPEGGLVDSLHNETKGNNECVNFLYVGRFYYKTKGVDVLMKAINYLKGRWSLGLVGGYGRDSEDIKAWIQRTSNVSFLNSWPSLEVSRRISQYDVVIVPSKYDGWNLLVNEAINAGVGVIVSDQATSDEVIRTGGAGCVFPSNNPKELAKAMQFVIDNPIVIHDWKEKAIKTSRLISPSSVGNYLIEVLDFFIYGIGDRPKCPWLNNSHNEESH